jgi:hypothetical protein
MRPDIDVLAPDGIRRHNGNPAIAATEFVLLLPAGLFMAALLVRQLQSLQSGPARAAQQVILWYADRVWTLWVLLTALPLAALVIGCVTLLRNWKGGAGVREGLGQMSAWKSTHFATSMIAAETLAAGLILAVVAAHILMN